MTPGLALLLVGLLIAATALFVAAEFALVTTSRGAIEQRASTGDRAAQRVLGQLSNLSFILSACQFGITVCSLLVGFLAEAAVGEVVMRPIVDALGLSPSTASAISLAGAFLLSTIFAMVVGELGPKNLAIARPEQTALATSGPLKLFGVLLGPLIRVFDGAGAWLTRRLFHVEAVEEMGGGLSLDELSRIIAASGREGALSDQQADLLARAVVLGDRRAVEVMIPRTDIVWLDADQPMAQLRDVSRDSGHSRFPVRTGEQVVGTVHVKDLLTVPSEEHDTVKVGDVAQAAMLVPHGESLRGLLMRFRSEGRTFGVVIDEYGGVSGLVTVEDLLEQLVGHIEDEHDARGTPPVRRVGAGGYMVSGRLPHHRIGELTRVVLPDGDYETVAGFFIDQLGRIPEVGDALTWGGLSFSVVEMDDARIHQLRITTEDHERASGESEA